MNFHLSIVLAIPLALLSACGGAGHGAVVPVDNASPSAGTEVTDTTLLERIMSAPFDVEYAGVRTVDFSYRENGVDRRLVYRERVYSDGEGQFSIDPLSVVEPPMDDERFELFELVQKNRESFFYHHRDFRVRNLDLFLSNYSVWLVRDDVSIASRNCYQLKISRRSQADRHFLIDVDRENGLVMRYRERNDAGRTIVDVTYSSINLSPAPGVTRPNDDRHEVSWRQLERGEKLDGPLGKPALPPQGYQLLEERVVTGPLGREWHELIYGDGVDQLFVLYGDEGDRENVVPDEINLFSLGPWLVAQGGLRETPIIAIGKVRENELLMLLESTLHRRR